MKLATNVKPSKCLSAAYMFKVCLLSKYSFQPTTNQSKLAITKAEEDATNTDQTFKMLTVLIRTLKSVFHETQDDIFMAAQNNPIHGLILSIRTLIQDRDKTYYERQNINIIIELELLVYYDTRFNIISY